MLNRALFSLFCLLVFTAGAAGQVSAGIQLTNTPVSVKATATGVAAFFYENATAPTAEFSVTPAGGSTSSVALNLGVGRVFIFTRSSGSPFQPGDVLGTAQTTNPGPYGFVLVQYAVAPPAPQPCSNGANGSLQYDNNGVFGCMNEVTYSQTNKALLTTTPLASQATIISISGNGSTATATCNVTNCGLTVGQSFYLDDSSQAACNGGPSTISSVSGNTASWASTNCTASTGGIFGQWLAVQYYANAASYPDVVSAFTVNQDGQFEMQTLKNCKTQCAVSTLLNLDMDGHVDLWGSAGGGLSTNTQGDTCLAATSGGCGNIRISANGGFSQYKGLPAVSGSGMPFIVYGVPSTPLTGTFGPFTLFTAPVSGYGANALYEVTGYAVATNSQPSSTLLITVHYTDSQGASSQSTSAVPFSAAGDNLPFHFILQCAPGSPITFTTSTNSGTTYNVQVGVTLR
jgi:hypothetical protein